MELNVNKFKKSLASTLVAGLVSVSHAATIDKKIGSIAPHTERSVRLKVARGLQECKDLEQNLVLAIIRVESNFKIDAVNRHSSDYGLMQVNSWHVKRKSLSKQKLLSDASYNMREGCKILKYFTTRYKSLGEAVSRWNCGTRKSCIRWDGVVRFRKKVLYYKNKLDEVDK